MGHTLGHSARFLAAAGAALPTSVIVSLLYRLMVLYAASRILPVLRAAEGAWRAQQAKQEESAHETEDEELEMDGKVKGKRKELESAPGRRARRPKRKTEVKEEPPFGACE